MLTIDWPIADIQVPQSYLTALGGVDYELDTLLLWDDLRELEDSDDGRAWSFTCTSNPPEDVGGILLARVLTILTPYTVSFEDTGTPYRVLFAGTNNNIQSKTNLIPNINTASTNSPGLVVVANPDLAELEKLVLADETLASDGIYEMLESGTPTVLATKLFTEDTDAGTMSLVAFYPLAPGATTHYTTEDLA